MKFYHVTSAFVAQRLLLNPEFIPTSNPSSHSYGLHGYPFRKGYFFDQVPKHQGVKLVLKWHGSIEHRSLHDTRPMSENILYIQYPWRLLLQGNHGANNLQLIGALDDGSGELAYQLGVNLTQAWLSADDYENVVKAKCCQFLSQYWRKCREETKFLQIRNRRREFDYSVLRHDNRELAEHLKLRKLIKDEPQAQRVVD
jgi:hypothetical protein